MFARVDANKDGFIDKAETDAVAAQRVAKAEQRAEKRAARFDPARDGIDAHDRRARRNR